MTKDIYIINKTDNGDETQSVEASFSICDETGEMYLGCTALFTFDITMTDSDIISWLIDNDFKLYNEY
jgi:hypothetical protein